MQPPGKRQRGDTRVQLERSKDGGHRGQSEMEMGDSLWQPLKEGTAKRQRTFANKHLCLRTSN